MYEKKFCVNCLEVNVNYEFVLAYTTASKTNTNHPVWNEQKCWSYVVTTFQLTVRDHDTFGTHTIAFV